MTSIPGPFHGTTTEYPNLPGARDPVIHNWNYADRRQMQEICANVFLGPYACAAKNKLESLKAAGITHIICIRHVMESNIIKPNFLEHFNYQVLDIADSVHQNIIQHLPLTRAFIEDALQSKGKVLIHGNAGISRSAAIVIGYIMEQYGLPYREAFQHVQHKRFCINPNSHFENQLVEYEAIFRARHAYARSTMEARGDNVNSVNTKRKYDDIEMDDLDCMEDKNISR